MRIFVNTFLDNNFKRVVSSLFCAQLGSISGRVIRKTLKLVLDSSLLNTQQYNVRLEGKVEQSRERSSDHPNTLV